MLSVMTIIIIVIVVILLGIVVLGLIKAGEAEFVTKGAVILFVLVLIFIFSLPDKAKDTEKGKYYSTQCQLIETNIDNGLFQSNTNKLKCGDVIENVTVSDYKEAIEAYQLSNDKENNRTPDKDNISVIK
ncbi:hypothetical protein AB7254_16800 [Providencia rettgeri]